MLFPLRGRATLLALLLTAACAEPPAAPTLPEVGQTPDLRLTANPGAIPTRAQERPGTFADMPDEQLWAHILHSDRQAVVGLKAPGLARGFYEGQVLLDRLQLSQASQAVRNARGVTVQSIDAVLPLAEVTIESLEALQQLRRLPVVDYIEPVRALEDIPQWASFGGCGWPGAWQGDWLTGTSGDGYSARYSGMRIPDAWTVRAGGQPVSGAGVTIGLTDTGISTAQSELRGGFARGSVRGRWVKHFFLSSFGSADDACGHGTRMAGAMVAPDDGRGVMGVAWGANLVNVRQADGVANISTSAARAAIRAAGDNESRIITMAWQSMNWWWQVSDEIKFWHNRRGVLFLAAAGTSGCGDLIPDSNVVFPAEMSEVVAVTGVRYPDGAVPCGVHYGRQVEVTAYLDVPTTGRMDGDVTTIGGSSNAAGLMAGIAALVWQANPAFTRDQVRRRLQESGSHFPVRNDRTGFGLVNAYMAVTGNAAPPPPPTGEGEGEG
jgi:serine protease